MVIPCLVLSVEAVCAYGALKAFLKKGNCTEMLRLSHHRLRPAPGQVVMVGAQQLHESHKLIYMGGFWYCGTCGFYATAGSASGKSSAKKLVEPCQTPTRGGLNFLARLQRHKTPKANAQWPLLHDQDRPIGFDFSRARKRRRLAGA